MSIFQDLSSFNRNLYLSSISKIASRWVHFGVHLIINFCSFLPVAA